MAKANRQYVYRDIIMVAGIVNSEPQVKISKNGNSYASFAVGERYGKPEDGYKYKNYNCMAYGDTGNAVLSQIKKNDNVMVIGHASALPYTNAKGQQCANMLITVVRFEKDPSQKMWEMKEKELEEGSDGGEDEESEETANAETLWGIDF